jgi:hypothetical protein
MPGSTITGTRFVNKEDGATIRRVLIAFFAALLILLNAVQYGISNRRESQYKDLAIALARSVASNVSEAEQILSEMGPTASGLPTDDLLLSVKKLQSAYEQSKVLEHQPFAILSAEHPDLSEQINTAESDLLYVIVARDNSRWNSLRQRLKVLAEKLPLDLTPDYLQRFQRAANELSIH